ncbi:MAG TPA: hypothetical protein VJU18_12135 [Vicinamibacteria bacterium]|nr:hypothetical protein [Vicinamibacteria bacterium]
MYWRRCQDCGMAPCYCGQPRRVPSADGTSHRLTYADVNVRRYPVLNRAQEWARVAIEHDENLSVIRLPRTLLLLSPLEAWSS